MCSNFSCDMLICHILDVVITLFSVIKFLDHSYLVCVDDRSHYINYDENLIDNFLEFIDQCSICIVVLFFIRYCYVDANICLRFRKFKSRFFDSSHFMFCWVFDDFDELSCDLKINRWFDRFRWKWFYCRFEKIVF